MTSHYPRRVVLTLLSASLLQLHALPGRAQTTTADGIDAFIRGDYQRAGEILKPIAERWPGEVDDAAGFFMAALFGNGLGLPRDVARACALYVRSAAGSGPFARLNTAMGGALWPTLTADQEADCLMLATLGFEHRFEPATFNLEPGHWITVDLSSRTQSVSATIAYQEKEKRSDLPIGLSPGLVFLPIEHTELQVGGAVPGRRHFIELFAWLPEPAVPGWRLMWSLSEVVREDLIPVATETLVTVTGDAPPAGPSLNLRSLVSLGLNAAGEAEWAILRGPDARREAIETDAARQEVRTQQQARKMADERVDWKRVLDPDRPPSFVFVDAEGCSELFGQRFRSTAPSS